MTFLAQIHTLDTKYYTGISYQNVIILNDKIKNIIFGILAIHERVFQIFHQFRGHMI